MKVEEIKNIVLLTALLEIAGPKNYNNLLSEEEKIKFVKKGLETVLKVGNEKMTYTAFELIVELKNKVLNDSEEQQ